MSYFKRAVVIPVGFILVAAILVETGFALRAALRDLTSPSISPTASKRLLLIGDSILGFQDEPGNIAGHLKRLLLEKDSNIAIAQLSRAGQTTSQLLRALPGRLQEFRPTLTIMMVGKSDYPVAQEHAGWLSRLRIYRFALAVIEDLNIRWSGLGLFKAKRTEHDLAFDPAWAKFGERKYDEVIPIVEAALRSHPHYEVGIKLSYSCYLANKEFERGEKFLRELAERSKHADLARNLAELLRVERFGGDKRQLALATKDLERTLANSLDYSGAMKTKLWLKKRAGDGREFAKLLAEISPTNSRAPLSLTGTNLQTVIAQLLEAGSRVIVVQYPMDHVETLRAALGKQSEGVTILESRVWLLEGPPEQTLRAVEDDIQHLTPTGAEIIAKKLKNYVD